MFFLIFLILIVKNVDSGKILIYSPSYTASHIISNGRIAEALSEAGHQVVVLIPEFVKELSNFTANIEKSRILRIPGVGKEYEDIGFEGGLMDSEFAPISVRVGWEVATTKVCDRILQQTEILDQLKAERFDAAFTEQIEFCGIGLIHLLGIRNLLWLSTTPLMDANSYNLGIPQPPSYVPVIEENDHGDQMDFWERLDNQVNYFKSIAIHLYATDQMTRVFRDRVSKDFPSVRDLASKASLVFVNTDPVFDLPRPISQKIHYIGGLGVEEPRKLDQELSRLLAKGQKGVVFFSLGSVALFDTIPMETRMRIIEDFSKMTEYHFIIKISNEDTTTRELIGKIGNIDTVQWIPQSDFLADPRVKLFVTHGGINGMIEAIYRSVPLVIVPVFADQFRNGRNAERRGIGKVVSKMRLENVGQTIREVLDDEKYSNSMKELSKRVRSHPNRAKDVLLQWTDYVLEFGPLDDLTLESTKMNFITHFNLDVLFLLSIPILLLISSIFLTIRSIFRLFFSKSPSKTKKE